jgi:oligopeptide/dipeptide ABC transporter ATP-binding protein
MSATAATDTPSPATPETVLQLRGLRTWFRVDGEEHRAVDGVDLSVARGRVLAIVGESGCGKSVTAYSILRLIQAPGRIVDGEIIFQPASGPAVDIAALRDHDERLFQLRGGDISMIFQEPMTALSPVHTIGNQIVEAIRLHQPVSQREAERLAVDMLRRVGIPDPAARLQQYPHELSGGMRQRVVISMALVCRPRVLIADEPTTALDVTIQAQILGLIKQLQQELDTAVVLITHDLGVVAQVADEVAVMYLGRVVEHGPVRRVLKQPQHPYTRALMDSLPSLHQQRDSLPAIPGNVPPLTDIPPGCPFHPRCSRAQAGVCDVGQVPALRSIAAAAGAAACVLVAEETS